MAVPQAPMKSRLDSAVGRGLEGRQVNAMTRGSVKSMGQALQVACTLSQSRQLPLRLMDGVIPAAARAFR